LGCRVVTALDTPLAKEFFGEVPPLYICETPQEIAAAMLRVMDDPDDLAGDGARTASWIQAHHSARRIVDLQVELYARLLSDKESKLVAGRKPPATGSEAAFRPGRLVSNG
jgi:hypothetical protein